MTLTKVEPSSKKLQNIDSWVIIGIKSLFFIRVWRKIIKRFVWLVWDTLAFR